MNGAGSNQQSRSVDSVHSGEKIRKAGKQESFFATEFCRMGSNQDAVNEAIN